MSATSATPRTPCARDRPEVSSGCLAASQRTPVRNCPATGPRTAINAANQCATVIEPWSRWQRQVSLHHKRKRWSAACESHPGRDGAVPFQDRRTRPLCEPSTCGFTVAGRNLVRDWPVTCPAKSVHLGPFPLVRADSERDLVKAAPARCSRQRSREPPPVDSSVERLNFGTRRCRRRLGAG
jgi:hypothetical protein